MRIVKANQSEVETINSLIADDKSFSSYVDWRSGHHNDFEDDVVDIYNYIHQSKPVIESPEEKPLFAEFINQQHEDFVDMQKRAKGNDILSYLATKSACQLYDKIIDNKLMQDAQNALDKAEAERTEEEQKAIKKAKTSMKLEVRKNIQKFKEEFDDAETALVAMTVAGNSPEVCPQQMSAKKAMDFLKTMKNNENVREIMKLVGKFQNMAKHKVMTKTNDSEKLVGIELGGDLAKLIPDEVALMSDPEFENLKLIGLIEEQLIQNKFEADQPKSGGPFVCCIDESGSMYGILNANAKAFLFGLWQVAKAEKRELVVVRFGGEGDKLTQPIKSVDDMLIVAENFINSGSTDFETPLNEARRIIENGGQFDKADIVFITDDAGRLGKSFLKEFNEFRKATKTKVISLSLVPNASTIKQFSDQVVYGFEDLADVTF
jgi:uncharacterized protein with von Willebrand factor type A (vWA) domain